MESIVTLSFLIWSTLIASLVAFWWGGDKVKASRPGYIFTPFSQLDEVGNHREFCFRGDEWVRRRLRVG